MSTSSVEQVVATVKALPPDRYGMIGLLRSEWTKLRSVRSTMWTLGAIVILGIGLSALATAETRAHWSSMSLPSRATFDPTQTSLIGIFFGQLVIGILGVLVISAEYGTGTIRATLSAAPRRPSVLLAKSLVFGVVSLVVAEVVSFAAYFLGQSLLTAPAVHTSIGDPGALRAVAGGGLYLCLLGLFALGLGTIIRHTVGAISAFVAVLLVIPLIEGALPQSIQNKVNRFLPANIGDSITAFHHGPREFSPGVGFGLMCLYALAALVIGGIFLLATRRVGTIAEALSLTIDRCAAGRVIVRLTRHVTIR